MGLITPPPTPTGSVPDIAVPDQAEIARARTAGEYIAGKFDYFAKGLFEHFIPGLSIILGLFVSLMDSILAQLLRAIGTGQGTGWQGMYSLISAALSDLLGVEVDAGTVQAAMSQGSRQANVKRFGQAFLDQIRGELTGGATGELPATAAGAYAWLGYGMEFAIREGNIEFLFSLIPENFRMGEGIRGYGVGLAENLGLGRLTRVALQSFMKILVADPMQNFLNQQYRPTILPVASLIKAWIRGGLDQPTRDKYLQYLGYKDEDIPQLILDAQLTISETQAIAMQRTGFYSQQQLQDVLTEHGVPTIGMQDFLNGSIAARSEAHLNSTVGNYLQLYKNRWISGDDLRTQLQTLGLGPVEISFAMGEIAPFLEYRTKELSASEVENAYLQGLIDLTYYADWAHRMGYAASDAQLLQYQLLLKQEGKISAAALAQWHLRIQCLAAVAKKEPPPPGWDNTCVPPAGS